MTMHAKQQSISSIASHDVNKPPAKGEWISYQVLYNEERPEAVF